MLHGFGAESTNSAQRHTNGPDGAAGAFLGPEQFGRIGLHPVAVAASIHVGREDQHAPASRFFDGGAETVVGRATVIERFAEERRSRGGIHFGARLHEDVLGERQGVAVGVEVARVLLQQGEHGVDLLLGPAAELAGQSCPTARLHIGTDTHPPTCARTTPPTPARATGGTDG